MRWYDFIRSYVWDDRTTPYLVPVSKLSQPQADKELFSYTTFLAVVFAFASLGAMAQAQIQENPLYFLGALFAVAIVCSAIVLAFTRDPWASRACIAAPIASLLAFGTGVLNRNLHWAEVVGLAVFSLIWLRYSLRVVAIADRYDELSPHLPDDLSPIPPSRRRGMPAQPPSPTKDNGSP